MMIDLHAIETWRASLRRLILYSIIRPKIKVGRNTDHRGFFLDSKAPEDFLGTVHEVERKLSIAKALGAEVANPDRVELEFKSSESDRASVGKFLNEHGIEEGQFVVGLNPGSFLPTRRWGKDKFAKIGERLARQKQARIVITGGSSEKALIAEIARSIEGTVPIKVTDFSLGELAVLLERLDLFITNDTGPMHIAVAVGTPIIAIFGNADRNSFANILKMYLRNRSSGSVAMPVVTLVLARTDAHCLRIYNQHSIAA